MDGLQQIVEALNDSDDVATHALVGHIICWVFLYIADDSACNLSFKDYLERELAEYNRLTKKEQL